MEIDLAMSRTPDNTVICMFWIRIKMGAPEGRGLRKFVPKWPILGVMGRR